MQAQSKSRFLCVILASLILANIQYNKQSTVWADVADTDTTRSDGQYKRAPKTKWETSKTDAVADYFQQLNQEPSYEALEELFLPMKYVTANFKVYPLILGEKEGKNKIRLVSDGSELHLGIIRGQRPCGIEGFSTYWFGPEWKASFFVGEGDDIYVGQPKWRNGYLPVAEIFQEKEGVKYKLEAFGAILPGTTDKLCAWIRISAERTNPENTAKWQIRLNADNTILSRSNCLYSADNHLFGAYDCSFKYDEKNQSLSWTLPEDALEGSGHLLLLDHPVKDMLLEFPSSAPRHAIVEEDAFDESGRWLADWAQKDLWNKKLQQYINFWENTLNCGPRISVPEKRFENALRGVQVGCFLIANGDQMNYSVHNTYERLYTEECGRVAIGLAYWGHQEEARRYLTHIGFYFQKGVFSHELGSRLINYCRYLSLYKDKEFLAANKARMQRCAQALVDDISDEHHGLGCPTKYAGDIKKMVYNLRHNALAWRGIRDYALLVNDDTMLEKVEEYGNALKQAIQLCTDWDADPPFVPSSLYSDDEPTPDSLTDTTLSSYWALGMPYTLHSRVLPDNHPASVAIRETYKRRGGLCAGLVRWTPHEDYSTRTALLECGIDDLYGLRLYESFARVDDADQLVLALYGKLAVGLTRDTYIGGEIASIVPSHIHDPNGNDGRSLYQPPNSTNQMLLGTLLRHCLVFDMTNDQGRYDTLKLALATPRRWLNEGQHIEVSDMPTAFGPVSYRIESFIDSKNMVKAAVSMPQRSAPETVELYVRTPHPERKIKQVKINGKSYTRFHGDKIDLSALKGKINIEVVY